MNNQFNKKEAYLQCLLEEYKQCKEEIMTLQRYQWRVQMFYIPSLILAFLGFYLKEVWSSQGIESASFSSVIATLFTDAAFITLVLWSAIVAILIILFTGSMVFREARHITKVITPIIETLIDKKDVFSWERVSLQRAPVRTITDDTLLYGVFTFGTLLLLLPITIAIACIYKGLMIIGQMDSAIRWAFLTGIVVSGLCLISSLGTLIVVEVQARRSMRKSIPDNQEDDHDTA